MDEASKGQQVLQAALKLNAGCEIALYHLAVMKHRQQPPGLNEAAEMLNTLLSAAPQHANGHLQLGSGQIKSDIQFPFSAFALPYYICSSRVIGHLSQRCGSCYQ